MPEIAFFFDLGGVLIENTGFDALRELGFIDGDGQEIRTRWLHSPSVSRFEKGQITAREFARAVLDEFEASIDPEHFLTIFRSWVKDFFPGAREWLAHLRAQHRVGCLSNCNEIHWRDEWSHCFDYALSSHVMGIAKPDEAAFSMMGQVAELPLSQIVYFDDSVVNVEAARSLGIQAHLAEGFHDVEHWFAEHRVRLPLFMEPSRA